MRLFLVFVFSSVGFSQCPSGTTAIADTLARPDASLWSGSIRVSLPNPSGFGPRVQVASVSVSSGVLLTCLAAGGYDVVYVPPIVPGPLVWIVPPGGGSYPVSGVQGGGPLAVVARVVSPSSIGGGGATTGQGLVWNGYAFVPGAAVSGLTSTIASGTAALGTSSIASGVCASAVSVAASGVVSTDDIVADFSADPTGVVGYGPSVAGMLAVIRYPGSGSVNFRVCNNTASAITPGAITLNWRVVR